MDPTEKLDLEQERILASKMQTQLLLQVLLIVINIDALISGFQYSQLLFSNGIDNVILPFIETDVQTLAPRRSSLAARRKAHPQNKSDPNISALQSTIEDPLSDRKVRKHIKKGPFSWLTQKVSMILLISNYIGFHFRYL